MNVSFKIAAGGPAVTHTERSSPINVPSWPSYRFKLLLLSQLIYIQTRVGQFSREIFFTAKEAHVSFPRLPLVEKLRLPQNELRGLWLA